MIEQALGAFATHERINQYLIENIPAEAWAAAPPGGKGRSVRAIVAHMHNVRLMWLKAILPKGSPLPTALEKDDCTPAQALQGFGESYAALLPVLREGLEKGKVKGFSPDAMSFLMYLVSHESHHRGQITSLAKRLGHPVPQKAEFGLWEWGSRSREVQSASIGSAR